jgi:hypothetical protein
VLLVVLLLLVPMRIVPRMLQVMLLLLEVHVRQPSGGCRKALLLTALLVLPFQAAIAAVPAAAASSSPRLPAHAAPTAATAASARIDCYHCATTITPR